MQILFFFLLFKHPRERHLPSNLANECNFGPERGGGGVGISKFQIPGGLPAGMLKFGIDQCNTLPKSFLWAFFI